MWASNPSGVIASSAGLSSSSGAAAKIDNVATTHIATTARVIFIWLTTLLRRAGGFGFLFGRDAELFQERFDRLFAAEEIFNRRSDIARVARFVDFVAQFKPSLFVEVAVLRLFENGRHVGRDRVGPGIAVIAGIVAVEMAEIRDKRRARVDRQKNFRQDWIRHRDAIIRLVFGMLIVQGQIERSESELSPVGHAGGGK